MTLPEGPSEEPPRPSGMSDTFTGPVNGVVMPFPARTAVSAYETVAWRAPTPTRFDGRPANDFLARAEAVVPLRIRRAEVHTPAPTPAGWFTFVVGACIAALLGALVGGLLSV